MPASTRVPMIRTQPHDDGVRVGLPPRGPFWTDTARLVTYVRGRGVLLVPGHFPLVSIGSGSSDTLRYKSRGSGLSIARIYIVRVEPTSGYASVRVTAGSASAQTKLVDFLESREQGRFIIVEEGVSKSSSVVELTILVENLSGTGTVRVVDIEVWELPRAALTKGATDLGVDVDTLFAGRPIAQRDYESVYGVAQAVAGASGRRGTLAAWFGPTATFSSASWTPLYTTPLRVCPGRIGPSDTSTPVEWDVYARVTDGTTTFDVHLIDAASGTSSVITVSGPSGHTSLGWRGPDASKSLLSEDLTDAAGLQSGAFETVNIEAQRTAGAGNLELRGWGLWEAPW